MSPENTKVVPILLLQCPRYLRSFCSRPFGRARPTTPGWFFTSFKTIYLCFFDAIAPKFIDARLFSARTAGIKSHECSGISDMFKFSINRRDLRGFLIFKFRMRIRRTLSNHTCGFLIIQSPHVASTSAFDARDIVFFSLSLPPGTLVTSFEIRT
jgi:hypothetical protein